MQCNPGDIFPCRNAGNLVPPPSDTTSGVAATIEYAVRVLKVPHIVICGHSDCGAMKGLLDLDALDELPMVRSWLEHAGPASRWLGSVLQDSANVPAERKVQMLAEANVIIQMQNLAAHPAVTKHSRRAASRCMDGCTTSCMVAWANSMPSRGPTKRCSRTTRRWIPLRHCQNCRLPNPRLLN